MVWKGLFQHLEGLLMDDYFEFKCAHEIHIEEWWLYWSPDYVSITSGLVALVVTTTTLANTNLINGNGNVGSSGSIEGSGTTRSGGIGPSTNARGPLLAFNLVVEFFCELWRNLLRGVRTKKLKNL
jgi:hypothetical protein